MRRAKGERGKSESITYHTSLNTQPFNITASSRSPFTSLACDASARPLTFNALVASVCNFSIAPSFSASLSL